MASSGFIFDEREAHVAVAIVAEADARRDGDLRLREELLGKLERAQLAVGLGRLIRQLTQAQAEWARKGGKVDSGELERASALIDEALETSEPDTN